MADPPRLRLHLLNEFALGADGREIEVPRGSQRVLALLGITDGPVTRAYAQGLLWPDSDERRAKGNLRSALHRLPQEARDVVIATDSGLVLSPKVESDVAVLVDRAHRLVRGEPVEPDELQLDPFLHDLLPAWYDPFVDATRERVRQLRVHALEVLAERFTADRRFGEGVEAGLAAVAVDPLRESAHLQVIRTHMAEGNRSEALRQYELLRQVLADGLGIEPSTEVMHALSAAGTGGPPARNDVSIATRR